MKILITGGTGFLGSRVARRLALEGHSVTAAGSKKMDLRNGDEVDNACRGQDIVIHCGALSAPWGREEAFYETNCLGTKHVIEGCFKHSVKRLIHISTPSLYFDFRDRFNINESEPLPRPCNAYAHSKRLAEEEIDRAFQEGLEVITLRPRGIFGPGDTTIFPRLILANREKKLPLINEGKALLDLTYVDNVVDAILLAMQAPKSALGKKFNITNGEPWTALALIKCLLSHLNEPFYPKQVPYSVAYGAAWMMELYSKYFNDFKEPRFTRYSVGVIAKSQTLDIQAAKTELGYVPKVGIEEGIHQFVKWWKNES